MGFEKFEKFHFVKSSQLNLFYHITCHEICPLISFWGQIHSQLMLKNWFSGTKKEITEKIEGFEILLMETNLARFHWPLFRLRCFFPDTFFFRTLCLCSPPPSFTSPRLTVPLPPPHSISWLPGYRHAPQCAGGGTRGTHKRAFDLFFPLNPPSWFLSLPLFTFCLSSALLSFFHFFLSYSSISSSPHQQGWPCRKTDNEDWAALYQAEWLISVCGGRPKHDVTYPNCEV